MSEAGNTRKVKLCSAPEPAADAAGLVDVVHAVELVRRDAVVRRFEDVVNTPCFLTKYSIIILKIGYFIHSRVYRIL